MSQAYASTNAKMDGGGVFTAPKGTSLPSETAIKAYVNGTGETDAKTLLAAAPGFRYVGDVSEDGVTLTEDVDTESFTDIDGNEVLNVNTSRSESLTLSFIDLDKDGLAEEYGHDNVTNADGVTKVLHTGRAISERVAFMLVLLADGRRMVRVIPRYKRTELGDETIAVGELLTREVTWALLPDASGNTAVDYVPDPKGDKPFKNEE